MEKLTKKKNKVVKKKSLRYDIYIVEGVEVNLINKVILNTIDTDFNYKSVIRSIDGYLWYTNGSITIQADFTENPLPDGFYRVVRNTYRTVHLLNEKRKDIEFHFPKFRYPDVHTDIPDIPVIQKTHWAYHYIYLGNYVLGKLLMHVGKIWDSHYYDLNDFRFLDNSVKYEGYINEQTGNLLLSNDNLVVSIKGRY